jgi:hypothetical protein
MEGQKNGDHDRCIDCLSCDRAIDQDEEELTQRREDAILDAQGRHRDRALCSSRCPGSNMKNTSRSENPHSFEYRAVVLGANWNRRTNATGDCVCFGSKRGP